MENLIFIHRGQSISKKIAGGLFIACAIIFLIPGKESLEINDWIRALMFFLIGVINFTPLGGFNKTQIEISNGFLSIIWINRFRKIVIGEKEIEKIILSSRDILIKIKERKVLKLNLIALKIEQKIKIFEFMIEYARQKNLVLEK